MHKNSIRNYIPLKLAGLLLVTAGSIFASGPATGGGGGTTTSACSWIQGFSAKAGYPPRGALLAGNAAIWTTVNFQQCDPAVVAKATFTVTNLDTNDLPQTWAFYVIGKIATTIDDDAVALNTNFRVSVVITDGTGAVLDSRSVVVLTPPAKPATTTGA